MENVTLRAHFDGRQIVLDEPFELAPGAKLIITVLPESADAARGGWEQPSSDGSVPAGGGRVQGQSSQDSPGFNEPTLPTGRRVVFNRVAIRDPQVNDIEGATLLLPEGWRLEGGFVWMPPFALQANLLVRAHDPQTGAAVEILPMQHYVWPMQMAVPMQIGQNWLGSVVMPPPRNAVEFVQNVYMQGPLQHLRGARLEGVEDMPQLAAELARAQGMGQTVHVTRLRYSYNFGGRGWEEDVNFTLTFEPSDGMIVMWYGAGNAMRAPAGELGRMRPLLDVPVQTLRFTLDWSAALHHARKVYQQGRAEHMHRVGELGIMLTQHRDEMRRVHQQTYEAQQASQDRISFARREVLGGVQTYVNPFNSRTVELPAGYRHNWVSDDGQVICTDEEMFDPQQGDRRTWQDMARYRP
jgi:hypothetical protein